MSRVPGPPGGPGRTPSLARRLASMVYESVLLFGLVVAVGLVYAGLTLQRHALTGQRGLQACVFLALACYFVWFWARQGQTLAMRTWRIRLERLDGGKLRVPQACLRFLLAWVWVLPALAVLSASGLQGPLPFSVVVVAGILTYAALSRLHPSRQFLHDALCGTRLVDMRPGSAPQSQENVVR